MLVGIHEPAATDADATTKRHLAGLIVRTKRGWVMIESRGVEGYQQEEPRVGGIKRPGRPYTHPGPGVSAQMGICCTQYVVVTTNPCGK